MGRSLQAENIQHLQLSRNGRGRSWHTVLISILLVLLVMHIFLLRCHCSSFKIRSDVISSRKHFVIEMEEIASLHWPSILPVILSWHLSYVVFFFSPVYLPCSMRLKSPQRKVSYRINTTKAYVWKSDYVPSWKVDSELQV